MSQTVQVKLNFTAETAQAEQALNRLQTSLRNISTQSNMDTGGFRFTQELNQASDAAIKLRQNLSNAINTNTNKLDLSKFRKEMDKSGMSLEQYRVALQQVGPEGQNAFINLSKAILASQSPLTHSIKLFDKLWDTLKRTAGWQISSLAIHGIQSSLSDAYNYAQDLNKSLNNIRIVTGYSADRMADFAKQANKAAKELSSTTLNYTDASLIYYQQGLDDKAVKERTDTTIKMANVTGTTAETVSQQMTAVWENFMKDGQHATEYYADVMTALGAATASSTDEIADGLEKFAAVADTVGLSYEYATSALTTITAKTRQSADVVGTALKTLFARIEGLQLGKTLEDGTTLNKYSKALEAVGVNIKDDAGNLKDMDNILDEIGAKWETLSKDQQVALAQTVAGVRQYTQFVALMDNWDFMGENLATAYGAEGTLEKQQKIYEESWEAARNRLQASVETLYDELLKDDFFIWLTDALTDVVGLVDQLVGSMGGLAGLLPGLILLMNKLWGDKIIKGISSAAYNVAGLIPSVNQKRQEADLATRNQALDQLRALRDYQTGGGRGGEAISASIRAYEQISKIEETRLRLGKNITDEQARTLDIYREQLEIMEKAAMKQGQAYNDARKVRNEQMNYVKILQAAAEDEIRKGSGPKYRSGAGAAWLNRVGANYTSGMDLTQGLPVEGGAAARGVLKYVRETSNNGNIQWADIVSYANGDKTAQNYNVVAQAIERLRDTSAQAEAQVKELQQILQFNPKSMSENPDSLQFQAERVGSLESAYEKLSNIMQRIGNTSDAGALSQLGAEFKKIFISAVGEIDANEEALKKLDAAINNTSATSKEYSGVMRQLIEGGGNVTSVTGAMNTANEKMNKTIQDLVVKYGIAAEDVTKLAQAMRGYAKDSSKAAEAAKILNDIIRQSSAGMGNMSTQIDRIAKIQNVVKSVSSLAMGLSSLTSALETISNPDLSAWDKFVSVGFSFSMVFGSFRSFFKDLKEYSPAVSDFINSISKLTDGSGATDQLQDLFKYTDSSNPGTQAELRDRLLASTGLSEETVDSLIGRVNELQASALDAGSSLTEGLTRSQLAGLKLKITLNSLGQALKGALPIMLFTAAITAFKIGVSTFKKMENAAQDSANALRAQASVVSDAYKEAQEAQNQFASNLSNYENAKTGLAALTEGTTEYTEKLLEANAAALELIQSYNNLKYSINSEGLIKIDEDSLKQTQENALKQIEYMQWSAMGSRVTADQAQTQANIVKTSRNMDTNSDNGVNSSQNKAVGIGALTGGATAALIAAGIATFLTGGLAGPVLLAVAGAAMSGVMAGGLIGVGVDKSYGSYSQEEINAINALGKANSEQWARVQAEATKDNNESGFLDAVRSINGLQDTSDDIIRALYHNFDAVSENVAGLQANTEALKVWAQGMASGVNRDNAMYQSLDEKDQAIADIVIGNNRILDEDEIDKNARMHYANLYGATSLTAVGIDEDDEEKYLKYTYGDDWENYQLTDTKGAGVTVQKRDEHNPDAWVNVVDEDSVSKRAIAIANAKYDALQMQQSDKELIADITSYRGNLLNSGMQADIVEQALQNYARSSKWDSSYFTEQQWGKFGESQKLTNQDLSTWNTQYDKEAYNQRMSDEGHAILKETAETYGMSEEALETYTEQLVENSDGLYKNYKTAAEATARHIKFAEATKNLIGVLDDELDTLKSLDKGSKKTSKQLESMSKVSEKLADMFGVEVSDAFYDSAENIELLGKVSQGSTAALQKLGANVLKDYFSNFSVDDAFMDTTTQESIDLWVNNLTSGLDTISSKINELNNGVTLVDVFDGSAELANEWIHNLNQMAAAAGWTADDMIAHLNSIGLNIDPTEVIETPVTMPTEITTQKTTSVVEKKSDDPPIYEVTSETTESQKPGKDKTVMVASIGQAANVKVDKSSISNAAGSIKPSSSGGGGGGGSKKDKKKSSDEIERYHVVKQQLDRLSAEYDRLSAAKDRAYGPDKLAAIDKEIAKLQEQEAMQKRYIDEIERYYQQDRAAIAKYGAVFDANGIITNYDSLMQKQLDIFNSTLTDGAEEAYNEFKEILTQYEETLSLRFSEMNNLIEKQYEIIAAKLEKITYKVEYKIEIDEDKLDYLERRLTRLNNYEKTNLELFAVNQEKMMTYWSQYATYSEAVKAIEAQINENKRQGLQVTQDLLDKLREYKKLMGEMQDNIYDIYNEELDLVSEKYSEIFDQLEGFQDRIREYRDTLETVKDMYSVLGVATVADNRAINDNVNKTYQLESQNIAKQIKLLEARQAELVQASKLLEGDPEAKLASFVDQIKELQSIDDTTILEDTAGQYIDKLHAQMDEIDQQIQEKRLEAIQLASDYLNAIKDQWVANIELIGQKTKDALYNGLEWAIERYGDLNELADLYLSNTKKIYELNKLNRNIQADINKTDNAAAKIKLRDLMKEINGYYADNVKMSEYELKNLQARYELRLAEIALEDARNAKSEVRLTRDNEGRWGYMYTANTEEMEKAEQDYEDKLYALQELQEDTLKDAGEKILSLQNDYISAMTELQSSDLSEEQKKQRAEELTSLYQDQLNYYYQTYSQALEASGMAYEDTILGQATNTKTLQEVMETFGKANMDMTAQMTEETNKFQENFITMVREMTGSEISSYEEAQTAWLKYLATNRDELAKATEQAADNFNEVAETIKNVSAEFKKMIEEMMVYLARLSGSDYSQLFGEALNAGNYDLALKYIQARRQKIDADPEQYGKYDWTEEKMGQFIEENKQAGTTIDDATYQQMLDTARTPYDPSVLYDLEIQKALQNGDYDQAGVYAEYRKRKMDNNPKYQEYAWSEQKLAEVIAQYAKDPDAMTEAQRRRILATAAKYDTGGYTGVWGANGRLAILHEKELVLNSDDTKNLLDTITLVRSIVARLDQAAGWASLSDLRAAGAASMATTIDQNVHIEASFPNVTDHYEIEQAFENIVNLASQYANRK